MDETAPDSVLEPTARAITYYLDVSHELSRRITQVSGALRAICMRLDVVDMDVQISNDLAQQIIKVCVPFLF